MKKNYTILAAVLLTVSVIAQTPQKMSYQSVIRDAGSELVVSTTVGMQISILQTTATGTAVYVETQTPATNVNGLVTLEIGTGTVVSGDFSTIDWSADTYFIKTEADLTGGTSYTITGTSQLLSVPYALHAKTAESVSGGHYVGELWGGGIVCSVYTIDGVQHGLITSLDNLCDIEGVNWSAVSLKEDHRSMTDGKGNTEAMVMQDATTGYAATLCYFYDGGDFSDWYLPSVREMSHLASVCLTINAILDNDGDSSTNGLRFDNKGAGKGRYWTSTESATNNAYFFYGDAGSFNWGGVKITDTYQVRAVRQF